MDLNIRLRLFINLFILWQHLHLSLFIVKSYLILRNTRLGRWDRNIKTTKHIVFFMNIWFSVKKEMRALIPKHTECKCVHSTKMHCLDKIAAYSCMSIYFSFHAYYNTKFPSIKNNKHVFWYNARKKQDDYNLRKQPPQFLFFFSVHCFYCHLKFV